jgi:hypothetical protein
MFVGRMTSRRMLRRAVLVTIALLGPVPPELARAEPARHLAAPDVENEKALQTFKEGIAAFDRRDFEAARVAFLQTFALKPSAPVVRRNLGLAEIYSGHYLEGARRLGRVIHTTDEGTSVDRARMVESLKKAEAHLERVTVEVNVEGAAITIGDVELGSSPLPFAWYLEPGSYDVRVSKVGFVPYSESRMARAGSAQHLRIHLKPIDLPEEPVRDPIPVAAAPLPVESDGGPNPWLLVAGSTLTAGGLVTGLALSMFAASNSDEVDRLGDALAGTNCRTTDRDRDLCAQLADTAAAHDQQMRWATVSFAFGAVAGVSTLLYALFAGSDATSRGSMASAEPNPRTLGVSLGANGTSLVLDGSF